MKGLNSLLDGWISYQQVESDELADGRTEASRHNVFSSARQTLTDSRSKGLASGSH